MLEEETREPAPVLVMALKVARAAVATAAEFLAIVAVATVAAVAVVVVTAVADTVVAAVAVAVVVAVVRIEPFQPVSLSLKQERYSRNAMERQI